MRRETIRELPRKLSQAVHPSRGTDLARHEYSAVCDRRGVHDRLAFVCKRCSIEATMEQPIRGLSRERTLIRYDARGNGMSDWDFDNLSLDTWVSDLEWVIDAAGVERFPQQLNATARWLFSWPAFAAAHSVQESESSHRGLQNDRRQSAEAV